MNEALDTMRAFHNNKYAFCLHSWNGMAMKVTKNAVNIAIYAREIHGTALYKLINFLRTEFKTAPYLFFNQVFDTRYSLQVGNRIHVGIRISNMAKKSIHISIKFAFYASFCRNLLKSILFYHYVIITKVSSCSN